jgi:catechol 2,3-dioxygenase-like lactoylglutathione lyase family enzyme
MFTHICVSAQDLGASKAFYDAVLTPLGVHSVGQVNERTCVFATETGKLLVMTPADGNTASHANGGTIGFQAADTAAVEAFYAAGLAAGGSDAGAPGPRPNAPGNAYGAYLRDPVGNKVCAFCQLPG